MKVVWERFLGIEYSGVLTIDWRFPLSVERCVKGAERRALYGTLLRAGNRVSSNTPLTASLYALQSVSSLEERAVPSLFIGKIHIPFPNFHVTSQSPLQIDYSIRILQAKKSDRIPIKPEQVAR